MTPIESFKICIKKYATFSGTANREEFWWFLFTVYVVAIVLYRVSPIIGSIFFTLTTLPLFAVATRRLHETGRSGWWQLVLFIPILGVLWYFVLMAGKKNDDTRYKNENI